jgi:glycosyltransferase involved in cell wall biosynthesis
MMHNRLRDARCYLYTGTQPASYTLGLIEAMMTGIPVVSIGPSWMRIFPYGPELFEGHELGWRWSDDPAIARSLLQLYLENPEAAQLDSNITRLRAIDTFGKDTIAAQWKAYLGAP